MVTQFLHCVYLFNVVAVLILAGNKLNFCKQSCLFELWINPMLCPGSSTVLYLNTNVINRKLKAFSQLQYLHIRTVTLPSYINVINTNKMHFQSKHSCCGSTRLNELHRLLCFVTFQTPEQLKQYL
jgi:hypothetical protein